ncbi:hypothetical protein PISMIDRAFT_469206 [Pisolithus microcarpus 441]|uniref:Unplaced genomic scaffold scaffold_459, whole genome shotgun sequence n=1 Tax=Pisolithus microcarpus 441 TaxID=765257 RepID=A0A0C9YNL8_9AGAM|nr:hypothetical protein PISMIDRAFT_469206 [Pisolithus microcarpus 441]
MPHPKIGSHADRKPIPLVEYCKTRTLPRGSAHISVSLTPAYHLLHNFMRVSTVDNYGMVEMHANNKLAPDVPIMQYPPETPDLYRQC